MDQRVAFHSGRSNPTANAAERERHWMSQCLATLDLNDWGLLQGAILVERLRTVGGVPLDVAQHLARLRSGAQELGIDWPGYLDPALIEQCATRNRNAHVAQDFSIVVLLTPGRADAGPAGSVPTVIVHTAEMNWRSLARWFTHGQPLITADARNVPRESWSPALKTRSRLHYFLADQQAARSGPPMAGAVMLSLEGLLTETSVANLLVIDDDGLVAPPVDSVLQGISLGRTVRLAESIGIPVRYRPITPSMVRESSGILLTGTSGCLWSSASLDGHVFRDALSHPTYVQLRDAWVADISLDYVSQAIAVAHTLNSAGN